MYTHASERRRPGLSSSFRAVFLTVALALTPSVHAQLALSATYAAPHYVDGFAQSIFFDLSGHLNRPDAQVLDVDLSVDFSKVPDLSDDPPFLSEIGLVLRKLDTSFSILQEVTLVEFGTFSDGAPGSFFSGALRFDDDAWLRIDHDPSTLTEGTFRGVEPLASLNGIFTPFWELRVVDASFQNPLLFHSATLNVLAAIPEPSTYGLFAATLLSLAVLRRRTTS
jgi:hypothetical protein